jgi:hypothetical protein
LAFASKYERRRLGKIVLAKGKSIWASGRARGLDTGAGGDDPGKEPDEEETTIGLGGRVAEGETRSEAVDSASEARAGESGACSGTDGRDGKPRLEVAGELDD